MRTLFAFVLLLALQTPPAAAAAAHATATPDAKLAVMDGDTVTVTARSQKLPDNLKQQLNQPLRPTPTDDEKKMRPYVEKAEQGFILWVWLSILAKSLGWGG